MTRACAKGWRRSSILLGGALALVLGGGCGDGDASTADPGDGSAIPGAKCTPRVSAGWAPTWKPPHAPTPNACTDAQIEREYALCESATATAAGCTPFRNDFTNATCLACLFSAEGDASYGPVIRLNNSSWKTNTPGCIALIDGDSSTSGCGARVQASSACYDAACDGCEPFASYVKCRQQAADTACRQFYLDSVCLLRPDYAICTQYVTNEEYFVAAAKFFCAKGTSSRRTGNEAGEERASRDVGAAEVSP